MHQVNQLVALKQTFLTSSQSTFVISRFLKWFMELRGRSFSQPIKEHLTFLCGVPNPYYSKPFFFLINSVLTQVYSNQTEYRLNAAHCVDGRYSLTMQRTKWAKELAHSWKKECKLWVVKHHGNKRIKSFIKPFWFPFVFNLQ